MGENTLGQLGTNKDLEFYPSLIKVPNMEDFSITQIACGNNHVICFERENRNVFAWGSNSQGQIIPYIKDEVIQGAKNYPNLKAAVVSKIFAGPHTTFCFSKSQPDFPNESYNNSNNIRSKQQSNKPNNDKENLE